MYWKKKKKKKRDQKIQSNNLKLQSKAFPVSVGENRKRLLPAAIQEDEEEMEEATQGLADAKEMSVDAARV